jgi:hypothetical protein
MRAETRSAFLTEPMIAIPFAATRDARSQPTSTFWLVVVGTVVVMPVLLVAVASPCRGPSQRLGG